MHIKAQALLIWQSFSSGPYYTELCGLKMPLSFFDPYQLSRLPDQSFGLGINPEDVIAPTYNFFNPIYFRPWKVHVENAVKDFGSAICNEKDKFKICLDVQQFRPNEIIVKTTKTEIIIEGQHDERADEHGYISRQFKRKYKFPEYCDSDTVTSNLTKDGVLIITAIKKCLKNQNDERIIPIKMCETCPLANISQRMEYQKDIMAKNEGKENSMLQKAIRTTTTDEKKCNKSSDKMESSKEHCSLLNTGGALKIKGNCDKMSESKIESCEEAMQITGAKFDKCNLASKSEASGFSSMSCETVQSKEAAFSSSISFDMKSSTEKTAEYINEIIATELKQTSDM